MNGFYSSVAGATLRWHDFPGDGLPVVFIHGLGCASSYDYPALPAIPRSANGAKYSSICRASAIAINRACLVTTYMSRL